jgi:hypothetical protein
MWQRRNSAKVRVPPRRAIYAFVIDGPPSWLLRSTYIGTLLYDDPSEYRGAYFSLNLDTQFDFQIYATEKEGATVGVRPWSSRVASCLLPSTFFLHENFDKASSEISLAQI